MSGVLMLPHFALRICDLILVAVAFSSSTVVIATVIAL
jgi:hypothetical protein